MKDFTKPNSFEMRKLDKHEAIYNLLRGRKPIFTSTQRDIPETMYRTVQGSHGKYSTWMHPEKIHDNGDIVLVDPSDQEYYLLEKGVE